MNNVKELSMTELQTITGGARSYGNGVYCNNKKCWVNCSYVNKWHIFF